MYNEIALIVTMYLFFNYIYMYYEVIINLIVIFIVCIEFIGMDCLISAFYLFYYSLYNIKI
jgi:hypothetical protein